MEPKLIAVDFDGTCTVTNAYPEIEGIQPHCVETLKALQAKGHRLILWTCREGLCLMNAISFMKEHGITFDAYNCNDRTHEWSGARKVYADLYLDDKMLTGWPGWEVVHKELIKKGYL